MSPSLRAYYVTAQCLAQDSPVYCIRPTEHATKAEHPPCREGTGVQRRGALTARSTNGEPPSLEWGPGRGRGLAGKVAVFNRYGGSFVRHPALAEEENQSGWADIPSPWTEPRALFPSGAQSSLWLCSKTLASAQGAGCSHSRLDLRPLPPPPAPLPNPALCKPEALENVPSRGRTAPCSLPVCSAQDSLGPRVEKALTPCAVSSRMRGSGSVPPTQSRLIGWRQNTGTSAELRPVWADTTPWSSPQTKQHTNLEGAGACAGF